MTGPNPSTAFEPRANSLQADEAHSETQIQTCSDLREGPLADYYIWRHPDRGLTICLNPETIDRLQCESLANVDRLEPGCEISGILLGRRQAHGQDKTVIVTGYRGVASIEQPGSQSAPYKTAAFEAVLRAINSSDRSGASSIVGFYRSHNRNGLYLSDDDLTLIQTYFSDPDTIVLIIKTLTIGACTAGFFFRDERGLLQSEFPQVELPLSPVEGVTHRRAKSSPAATPVVPIRAYLHAEPDMQPVAALTAAGRPSSTGRNPSATVGHVYRVRTLRRRSRSLVWLNVAEPVAQGRAGTGDRGSCSRDVESRCQTNGSRSCRTELGSTASGNHGGARRVAAHS